MAKSSTSSSLEKIKMKHTITIIGYGRVGKLLYNSLKRAGYKYITIIKKDEEISWLNDCIILCVPDNKIKCVLGVIQQSGIDITGKTFVHTSGAVGLDVFSRLENDKIYAGCMHPMMAVTDSSKDFKNITFDICGSNSFEEKIKPVIHHLKAKCIVVDELQKLNLHIAAVLTSNYMVTLMGTALQLFKNSDLDHTKIRSALLPLMNSVLSNLEKEEPSKALTGPIFRVDISTLQKHLEVINDLPNLKNVYTTLAKETINLLVHDLSNKDAHTLRSIFDE
jgi:predicted short-subunit dehydrogenase-like oxidoreductase (DUF2520 family)